MGATRTVYPPPHSPGKECKPTIICNDFVSWFTRDELVCRTNICDQALSAPVFYYNRMANTGELREIFATKIYKSLNIQIKNYGYIQCKKFSWIISDF